MYKHFLKIIFLHQTTSFVYSQTPTDKMKIDLYIEALCSDCKNASQKSYTPAIQNGLLEMADVNYIIAGNASHNRYIRGDGVYKFTCQFGVPECHALIYQNCMLKFIPDKVDKLLSISCMFDKIDNKSDTETIFKVYQKCASQYSKSVEHQVKILNCAEVDKSIGYDQLYDAILETPGHNNIPWAVVENKPLSQKDRNAIDNNILKWACENYQGVKPKSCENTL